MAFLLRRDQAATTHPVVCVKKKAVHRSAQRLPKWLEAKVIFWGLGMPNGSADQAMRKHR
jgi:hypothetical protein